MFLHVGLSPQLEKLVTAEMRSPCSLRTNMQDYSEGSVGGRLLQFGRNKCRDRKANGFEGKLTCSHVIKPNSPG